MYEVLVALRDQVRSMGKVDVIYLTDSAEMTDASLTLVIPGTQTPARAYLTLPDLKVGTPRVVEIVMSPEWTTKTASLELYTPVMIRGSFTEAAPTDRPIMTLNGGNGALGQLPFKMRYTAVWDGSMWCIPDAILASS